MTKGKLKLRALVLCEDIRWERSERQSLMGVFTGAHVYRKELPADLRIGVAFFFSPVEPGTIDVEFEVSGPPLELPRTITGAVDLQSASNQDEIHLIPVGVTHVRIVAAGDLLFRFRQNGGEWENARMYRIKHKPLQDDHDAPSALIGPVS